MSSNAVVFALSAVLSLVLAAIVYLLLTPAPAPVVEKKKQVVVDEGPPKPPVGIYFGSQTGTAEGFAKVLASDARRHGFAPTIVDMEDFTPEALAQTKLVIFAMSTYGEGEPTDNAHIFVRWAKAQKAEGNAPLTGVEFAVFGLGNKQYEQFNAMGKLTDSLLETLGGKRRFEMGIGDDDDDLEADFEQWRAKLWPSLGGSTESEETLELTLGVSVDDNDFEKAASLKASSSSWYYFDKTSVVEIVETRELRKGNDGSTRHIEFATAGLVDHETADNLAVMSESSTADVQAVSTALGVALETKIALKPASGDYGSYKAPFPSPCTLEEALRRFCDLAARPKRPSLVALAACCPSNTEIKKILALKPASFKEWVETSPHASSLAATVSWASPSFELSGPALLGVFFEHVAPRLQPRYYTISSSKAADSTCHITVAILQLQNERLGLCTGYLGSLRKGDTCRVFNRPSSFRAPPRNSTPKPLILVGPGTGIAPMRAVMRELEWLKANPSVETEWAGAVSRCLLYFGCKKRNADGLYSDEMDRWVDSGVLDRLEVAYSREQVHKVYVQDLIKRPDDAADLARALIDEGGAVFVCGGVAMGASVMDSIRAVLLTRLKPTEATAYLDKMKHTGRYVQELWA